MQDFFTVYLCCYCRAGPRPGLAMMGQMQEKDKCWRSDCWRAYQCSLKGLDHSVLQLFLLFIFLIPRGILLMKKIHSWLGRSLELCARVDVCECVNAWVHVIIIKFCTYFSKATNTRSKCIGQQLLPHWLFCFFFCLILTKMGNHLNQTCQTVSCTLVC